MKCIIACFSFWALAALVQSASALDLFATAISSMLLKFDNHLHHR